MAEARNEHVGSEIELDVTKIAHGGIAVARHEGRVVFVSDAIPGERVLARVTDARKKSFWRADTVSVLQPSEHRRDHIWAEASVDRSPANRAGGAEFGHIDLPFQRELKRQVLTESLERMAGVTSDVQVEALEGDDERGGLGWRTRVSLHVGEDGRPGPYAARSHRVIAVTSLPLTTPELSSTAPLNEKFVGNERVDVVHTSGGGVRLIIDDQKPSTIIETVGERRFQLSDRGFWQVHREAPVTLSSAVSSAVNAERFDPTAANLDLYGGVGLLAAAVLDRFGAATRITTVEGDARATDHASENLAEWLGARAETGRVEHWLRDIITHLSAAERSRYEKASVVLDPPRAGAGKPVVDALAQLRPAQIVYVACDPVAFARDVALFADHGYRLEGLRAFDLFPHTHHVEAVSTLVRD